MVTFQIDSIKKTAKGNLSIKAVGGGVYYAKEDTGLDGKAGKTIDAETSNQDLGGGKILTWINKYKLSAVQQSDIAPQQPYSREPVGQAPQGRFTPNGTNLDFLPFVSNTVNAAVRSGHADTPEKIEAWAKAAYRAALSLGTIEPF